MTRITPRTCLWPLAGSLSLTFALSIGLTFQSDHHCFAGTCGEWLFPLQARLHVVVWYSWLSISVSFLAVRAFHPGLRQVLRKPLFERKIPVLGKQLAVSGLLVSFWIILLYGIIVGIWWIRIRDYFEARGLEGGLSTGNGRLAAIALTGHWCDVTMGMALIPISRHSALASFFKISVATTLAFHMITAYTLFTLVMLHGFLYVSWLPVFESLSTTLRMVYPVLNPTYLFNETWPGNMSSLGVWRSSLIFTGMIAAFIMVLIFITTLPVIRSQHFNIFYFTHLLSIVAVIIICLHASTMFYCTSPGILMWILDWSMRLYELRASLNGKITSFGKGWYSLTIPLPRNRLDGCACTSPLAHFYIHHSDSSIRELHPFTTTTHLASQNMITYHSEDDIDIQFLFRKQGKAVQHTEPQVETELGFAPSFFSLVRRMRYKKPRSQWTDKLAGLVDTHKGDPKAKENSIALTSVESAPSSAQPVSRRSSIPDVPITLRLEGPYFTPADPARYNTVVCIVAGTGVSGALAIAGAFREAERQCEAAKCLVGGRTSDSKTICAPGREAFPYNTQNIEATREGRIRVWKRCIVLWSVRESDFVDLPGLKNSSIPGLEVHIHLTGNGRSRLSVGNALDEILQEDTNIAPATQPQSTWVYVSGPNAFIAIGEAACKERQDRGVEWYGAKWDI